MSVSPTYENFERALRNATPPTADDLTVLVGMDRPATRDELKALIAEYGGVPDPGA